MKVLAGSIVEEAGPARALRAGNLGSDISDLAERDVGSIQPPGAATS